MDQIAFKKYFDRSYIAFLKQKMDDAVDEKGQSAFLKKVGSYCIALAAKGTRLSAYVAYRAFKSVIQDDDIDVLMPVLYAIELMHLSALVHDDLIGDIPIRDGEASLHERFSKGQAVLFGDLCFSFAAETVCAAALPDEAKKLFYKMTRDMIVGQMHQVAPSDDAELEISSSIDRIEEFRTARSTFVYPAAIGRAVAKPDNACMSPRLFGCPLGKALHRINGVADVMSLENESHIGSVAVIEKNAANRVVETFFAIAPHNDRTALAGRLKKSLTGPEKIEMLRLLHASGAIAAEKQSIARVLAETEDALDGFNAHGDEKALWYDIIADLRAQLSRV